MYKQYDSGIFKPEYLILVIFMETKIHKRLIVINFNKYVSEYCNSNSKKQKWQNSVSQFPQTFQDVPQLNLVSHTFSDNIFSNNS